MNNIILEQITNIFFWITLGIGIFFMFITSFSEWLYLIFSFAKKKKIYRNYKPSKNRNFAIIIPAHNESAVVGKLIDSIKNQKYDGLIDIYLVADNCTDQRQTYNIGIDKNINVLQRFHKTLRGGNFAIQYGLRHIRDNNLLKKYDCFCSFDADNVLDENWVYEVNKLFDFNDKVEVVTTYRNSKNFGDNWISSANSIQFIKESNIINKGRATLGYSAYVNGTGFSFTRNIL